MTLFFSCLRCKKIAVTPLEEIGRSIRPSDFVFFNFVCNSETLNDVFGSRQRLHGSCLYGALVCIRVAPKLCIVMGCFLKKE